MKGERRGKKEWKENVSRKDWKHHFISLLENTKEEKEEEIWQKREKMKDTEWEEKEKIW